MSLLHFMLDVVVTNAYGLALCATSILKLFDHWLIIFKKETCWLLGISIVRRLSAIDLAVNTASTIEMYSSSVMFSAKSTFVAQTKRWVHSGSRSRHLILSSWLKIACQIRYQKLFSAHVLQIYVHTPFVLHNLLGQLHVLNPHFECFLMYRITD